MGLQLTFQTDCIIQLGRKATADMLFSSGKQEKVCGVAGLCNVYPTFLQLQQLYPESADHGVQALSEIGKSVCTGLDF